MNWIITLFVKRPVFSSMVYIGIAMFGIIAWVLMPRELFPNVSLPQLNVISKYANAAPEEIENLITKPLEESIGTVPNLKRVRSISKEGISVVTLEFISGTDMGLAHLTVREKLDRIKSQLPSESDEPIVKRVNPFAHALIILSITGKRPLVEITEIAKQVIKQRLEKVEGVAAATLSGGQEKEIHVELDRGQVEAQHLSLNQVVQSLKDSNFNYPAGTTQGKFYEYLVRTIGEYEHVSDIGLTVVSVENPKKDNDGPMGEMKGYDPSSKNREKPQVQDQRIVILNTIGTVVQSLKEKKSFARYNGQENVSISIQKQADVNTVEVAERVKAALSELKLSLPKDLGAEIVYDESEYVLESLNGMRDEALTGGLLALIVLFFFFGSFRDAFNVGLSIPLSLLLVFIMIYFQKMSLNFMTLAALSMSMGKFSDDAIVVAENVVRHNKVLGKPPKEAAIEGGSEVAASMVSSTLTNIAVLLPLLFVGGVAQQLFRDLFIVTAFSSFASMVVSLTIIPRLAAYPITMPKIFSPKVMAQMIRGVKPAAQLPVPGSAGAKGAVFEEKGMGGEIAGVFSRTWKMFTTGLTEEAFEKSLGSYEKLLAWVISNRILAIMVLLAMLVGSVLVMMQQEKVFMPKMDQGQFIVQVNMPVGTRLEITDRVASRAEHVLMGLRSVKSVTVSVGSSDDAEEVAALGPHQAQCVVALDRSGKRSSDEVLTEFKSLIAEQDMEGAELIYILQDSPLRAALAGGAPIEVEIKGPELETLKKLSDELVRKMTDVPGLQSVKSSYALPSQETRVKIDKDRASSYGLSVSDIAKNALIAIKGSVASTFKEAGKEIDIRVQLREEDRTSLDDIRHLVLYSPSGMMVPLEEVASIQQSLGASEISHLDQQRAVVVSAEVFQRGMSDAILDVQKILEAYKHVPDYTFTLAGESQRMDESFGGMGMTTLLAVALVYMIMAAQFESLWQPFVIMFTVPFSFIGVAITLQVTKTPLSAVVMLSMVMLGGIVVNNGIVLIDHINVLRADGLSPRQASMEGAKHRVRPILMTMLTAVLGVLPMALGLSHGSELAQPMALVTFGGLFVSTMLTLVVIPMLYMWVDERRSKKPTPAKGKLALPRPVPALGTTQLKGTTG